MDRKRQTLRMLSFAMSLVALTFFGSASVWAVYAPEPKSGGRFFNAKGTLADDEYRYLGRTGERRYDDPYYGKGINVEGVRVNPYASYTGEWDTNIFLEEDNRDADYISRLNWGTDAEIPLEDGKYVFGGGVHSESEWFAQHGGENHTDWTYQGAAELNFNRFSLELFEQLQRTVNRVGNELTNRQDRYENYLSGLLTIPFADFFQETEVSHYNLEFRDPSQGMFDRQELRVIPRIGINVGDRTQALMEYGWTYINYDDVDDRNGMAHQLALGVRGLLGQGDLVNYQAWAGWQFRNYNSDNRQDFSGFVARGEVEYRRTELSRFFINANRSPVESVTTNNSFIVRNEIAGGWRRQLAERLWGEVGAGIGFYDYSSDRFDFYWEPKVRLDYVIPNTFARLFTEYRYTARHSDVGNQDYGRHLWNAGVRLEV
jgi:hypothetical protein